MEPEHPQNAELLLDADLIISIVQPKGLLSGHLSGFEPREQQQKMLSNVTHAYNHNEIALIEAGTGTGKSISYLIPAILWAVKTKQRTLISTHTINLQEQLIEKDIPMLLKGLNVTIKAVLVKGMNNYICLRRLREAMEELPFLSQQDAAELQKIDVLQQTTCKGSRSELPFIPSPQIWEAIGAEADTCTRSKCAYFDDCYFFKARREASEAQILVSNHHLLFADLASRAKDGNYNDPVILPPYSRIIIDEAHHIEDVATEYFASHISRIDINRILTRLAFEKNYVAVGKLPVLKQKIEDYYRKAKQSYNPEVTFFFQRLNAVLPGEKRDLQQDIGEAFHAIYEYVCGLNSPHSLESSFQEEGTVGNKLRLKPEHYQSSVWCEKVLPRIEQLLKSAKRYIASLQGIAKEVEEFKDEKLAAQLAGIVIEITALANRLSAIFFELESFIAKKEDLSNVRWIEMRKWQSLPNVTLIEANLDISEILIEFLFSKFPTVILCSATLTTDKQFHFIRERLGLNKDQLKQSVVTENSYDSPFNFQQQTLFAITRDIPHPDHPEFIAAASEKIWQAIQASRGNAFVLFTSYGMLTSCYQTLIHRLQTNRFHVFKQGDDNRRSLLEKFKAKEYSVLFGTDSFWEGVDVMGDALRCVIIVKLPFKVPSDPLIEARSELIVARGGNPFIEYFVPHAIMKFKQGFGRLIRHRRDRGCVVCLDNRLMTKSYGRLFLNSLPSCPIIFESDSEIQEAMTTFYRKTYHLVHHVI